jgi:CheY-like chemotaxis protein
VNAAKPATAPPTLPVAANTETPAKPVIAPEVRPLVLSLAEELANLISGVEGRTHNLIEAAAVLTQVPAAAEDLAIAVQRLRTLHSKLAAFGHARCRSDANASTPLLDLVARLRDEVQHQQLGLELRWDPPPHLAEIAMAPEPLHDALSFLCAAMLRAERGASRLSVVSELCFASTPPRLQLELVLDWNTEAPPSAAQVHDDLAIALDLEASNHLITSHGGEQSFHHLPGRSVRAVVRLAVVPKPELVVAADDAERPPAAPHPDHRYGGALVLEADPAVRAMLARELKATGRAVFACADGASARSFLEATPDRFEVLIVDDPQRLDIGQPLVETIRELTPGLKIFALSPGHTATLALPLLHHISKPFGVHELRAALASVLAAG